MKQKNKITEIKKSNALINAFYNISAKPYKPCVARVFEWLTITLFNLTITLLDFSLAKPYKPCVARVFKLKTT
jgi:hypothetical protein